MFGRKQREIARLTQENKGLRSRIEEVKSDPYYLLAQQLGAEVEGIVSSGANVDTRVTDAIAKRRAELLQNRIGELARTEIERQTAAEKAAMDQEAQAEASKLAATGLTNFLPEGRRQLTERRYAPSIARKNPIR